MSTTTRARRPLTRARILTAALRLVDREGLEALSMRRLGQALGVEAMSLYNHVPNKAAVLDGLVELLLGELEIPGPEAGDWWERIRRIAHSYRRSAHAHPHAFPLAVTRPYNTPATLRQLERRRWRSCIRGALTPRRRSTPSRPVPATSAGMSSPSCHASPAGQSRTGRASGWTAASWMLRCSPGWWSWRRTTLPATGTPSSPTAST